MECRHPITNEWCDLTNKEWRCIKLAIPSDCTRWELMCAEQDYEKLITVVAERQFSPTTMKWLIAQLIAHKKNVLTSPRMLHEWYMHVTTFYDVDTIVAQIEFAAKLRAKLERLQESRKADTMRMMRKMQRQIEELKKARVRKIRAKNKRR